jgi:hypothetical protein
MKKPTNALILQCIDIQHSPTFSNILTITLPVTIYSFHASLLPTALGTYLSRIMIGSLMMAF